jgi:hypothetical protein
VPKPSPRWRRRWRRRQAPSAPPSKSLTLGSSRGRHGVRQCRCAWHTPRTPTTRGAQARAETVTRAASPKKPFSTRSSRRTSPPCASERRSTEGCRSSSFASSKTICDAEFFRRVVFTSSAVRAATRRLSRCPVNDAAFVQRASAGEWPTWPCTWSNACCLPFQSVTGSARCRGAFGRYSATTESSAVVRDNVETLYAAVAAGFEGAALPTFVRRELERYLDCGLLCRGFARMKCDACVEQHLLAFSCKGRGFCPSCLGRRPRRISSSTCSRPCRSANGCSRSRSSSGAASASTARSSVRSLGCSSTRCSAGTGGACASARASAPRAALSSWCSARRAASQNLRHRRRDLPEVRRPHAPPSPRHGAQERRPLPPTPRRDHRATPSSSLLFAKASLALVVPNACKFSAPPPACGSGVPGSSPTSSYR